MIPPIIAFVIIFSILVLVHELGHFIAAKKAGIKIEEFGFGYPPRIFSLKFGETVYSLNIFPLGGFVRLYGEEGPVSTKSKIAKRAFFAKSKKTRIAVLLAGVLANFLLGVVCFSWVYGRLGIPTKTDKVIIAGIAKDSPAAQVGLETDDVIIAFAGEEVHSLEQFTELVDQEKGHEAIIKIKRSKEGEHEFTVIPRVEPPEGEGAIGVALTNIQMVHYPLWQMPFRAIWVGVQEALGWGTMVTLGLVKMIRLLFIGQVPQDIAGPVGIYQLTTGVARQGFLITLQFTGILSVNLAILNVIPFPALDGGRIIFIFLEKIIGRRIRPKIEQITHAVGMALLLFLMLVITINDLSRFQFIADFFKKIASILSF